LWQQSTEFTDGKEEGQLDATMVVYWYCSLARLPVNNSLGVFIPQAALYSLMLLMTDKTIAQNMLS